MRTEAFHCCSSLLLPYSRDEYKAERLSALEVDGKLFRCHTIMNCARACPKHRNPGKAIAQMRRMMVTKEFTSRPDEMPLINPSSMKQKEALWSGGSLKDF